MRPDSKLSRHFRLSFLTSLEWAFGWGYCWTRWSPLFSGHSWGTDYCSKCSSPQISASWRGKKSHSWLNHSPCCFPFSPGFPGAQKRQRMSEQHKGVPERLCCVPCRGEFIMEHNNSYIFWWPVKEMLMLKQQALWLWIVVRRKTKESCGRRLTVGGTGMNWAPNKLLCSYEKDSQRNKIYKWNFPHPYACIWFLRITLLLDILIVGDIKDTMQCSFMWWFVLDGIIHALKTPLLPITCPHLSRLFFPSLWLVIK